ncbi:streptophobe family protein [Streptomyces sp. AV19]|uniref:streptophobe family protein n=1 Tax=Streptomyces sp. AV19 TaxID=2793068 RepID=UPI002413998B|nr:streptophobe family protein [Streptomyces sp. AV19]MDG4532573.1 proline-rich domain-containing protein [Streptomyces sp. AV19]
MTITSDRGAARGARLVLTAVAGVGWAFLAMAAVAALGLHLLGADRAGSLGPMTAAVVVLATGGSVEPSGAVEAFGLTGAGARSSVDVMPLGVTLVGALVLGLSFARSLRPAGLTVGGRELAARAGAVAVVFLLLLGGLAWAGSSTVTIDGTDLVPGGGGGGPKLELPGIGDVGDLPDRLTGLARARAAVGFSVRTGPSLLGGAVWVLAVLLVTLLVARAAPLPRGARALHRSVRPAASALCAVLVLAVAAGWAAAAGAAAGDGHPGRVAGAALLGTPNGVWLGLPLGLFVPWHGRAAGSLLGVLPDPLDRLLAGGTEQTVGVGRLVGLDHRVWLLPAACGLAVLLAGVLTAVRTPRGTGGAAAYAGRCALALGAVTAVALPLLALATRVRADASLSVLGIDAAGAGIELRGSVPLAAVLGAAWGLAAGAAGGLLAWGTGAAGRRASPYAYGGAADGTGTGPPAGAPGPHRPSPRYRPSSPDTNPYLRPPAGGDRQPRRPARGQPPEQPAAGHGHGPSAGSGPKQRPAGHRHEGPHDSTTHGADAYRRRPAGERPPERSPEPPSAPPPGGHRYGSPPPPPPGPPPPPKGWPGPGGRPPRR